VSAVLRGCGPYCGNVDDVQDKACRIGNVHLSLLINPDLSSMIRQQDDNAPGSLDPGRGVIRKFSAFREHHVGGGANLKIG
jgi:hypothetical protein